MSSPSLLAPLIDSHCHLEYEYEDLSTQDLVQEATENGVVGLITIGTEKKNHG